MRSNSERVEKLHVSERASSSRSNTEQSRDFEVDQTDRSNRETRKLARKIYTERKYNAVYNAAGINVVTGKDCCDCLDPACDGCHFPCLKCRSMKCGHECRQNRRWEYQPYETLRLPKNAEEGSSS